MSKINSTVAVFSYVALIEPLFPNKCYFIGKEIDIYWNSAIQIWD